MKFKFLFLIFTGTISISTFSQTYITNVTLIDVVKQKLIPAQTVVIKDDIISNIQPSGKIKIPAGATIIDGKGKYLMPGLTDAHVHFFQSGGLYTRPDALDLRKNRPYDKEIEWVHNNMEDFLRRYLQNGITSVIDVGCTYSFLQQRDSFANKNYSPSIYMTGPLLTSYEPDVFKNLKNDEPFILVKTPEDGTRGVQQELAY
ncbi:MAG TPA: amidohydrolase family protein, partial [Ginsengibacter sp.]